MTVPSKIDRSVDEIIRMEDLGEVIDFAIKGSAIEAAVRRSGKFTGNDYYRVARAVLWAEWRAGHLLRGIQRQPGGRPSANSYQADKSLDGFLAAINLHNLKQATAYRWITMSWTPQAEAQAYMDKRKAANQRLKRSDLVRMGKASRPIEAPLISDDYEIIHADLIDANVADASVDYIITDPPYPKEFIGEYGKLSAFAARVLKPGGSCFAMAGQSYLPDVMAQLGADLTYHWTLAYLTPGGQSVQQWNRHINTFWKPILWFVKGEFEGDWSGDVLKSDVNDNDKRFHHWGQSESGIARLVERFSRPDDLICDPFVGGGTTAVVSLARGRRFIGIDKSNEAVGETLTRIASLKKETAA